MISHTHKRTSHDRKMLITIIRICGTVWKKNNIYFLFSSMSTKYRQYLIINKYNYYAEQWTLYKIVFEDNNIDIGLSRYHKEIKYIVTFVCCTLSA